MLDFLKVSLWILVIMSQSNEVEVVKDFLDVFMEDITRLPPDREVEFGIEFMPGATPISKSPYRLVPTEVKELKEKLEELLEK